MKRFLLVLILVFCSGDAFDVDFCDIEKVVSYDDGVIKQILCDNYIISIYRGYRSTIKEKDFVATSSVSVEPADYYKCTTRKNDALESDIIGGFIFVVKVAENKRDDAYCVAVEVSEDFVEEVGICNQEFFKPYRNLLTVAEEFLRSCGCKKILLSQSLCYFETGWFYQGLGFDLRHKEKFL